jgi:hypothetical protein
MAIKIAADIKKAKDIKPIEINNYVSRKVNTDKQDLENAEKFIESILKK